MIDKRLIGAVKESRIYIAANVAFQWVSLVANIAVMGAIAYMLQQAFAAQSQLSQALEPSQIAMAAAIIIAALAVRFACSVLSSRMSYLSSKAVKRTLRQMIYSKLLRLGPSYKEKVQTSGVVQIAVEGVDQLETYFGSYLPQLFYAILAPVTLFCVLGTISMPSAVVLLICVPLIPVTIIAIQRWAKRLLAKYWGQYSSLGDTFLENLQGLTTTKIYQSDAFKHQEMNEQSERFRKITMKVLMMQLNSISVMDLIAYGGAALGVILAVTQFQSGSVSLAGCLMIILLAADFFLPMRMLGSFFHIAMNGMAASDKMFVLLDLPEPDGGGVGVVGSAPNAVANGAADAAASAGAGGGAGGAAITAAAAPNTAAAPEPASNSIELRDVRFAYEPGREILGGVSMSFPEGSFSAIVGESGSGKSTIASIIMGRNLGYSGEVAMGGVPIREMNQADLMSAVTYVGHQSYLFKGTVRDNLLMGSPDDTDSTLWNALEQVNLADFLRSEQGLDTVLAERASNLSGGQRQRLAFARALLHDSPVYIFDEATSNIDVESENDIMAQVCRLAETKTVILISHRLANVVQADCIYAIDGGAVVEHGTHNALLASGGAYSRLWEAQQELERYVADGSIGGERHE